MIHITDENKKYYFPIDIQPTDTDSFILNLYSELSLSDITFNELEGEVEDDYIGIVITTEMAVQVPNGEYNYTLYDGEGERVGIGLIRFDLEDGGAYPDEPEYVVYDDEMDGGYITTQNQEEAYQSGYTDGVNSVILVSTGFTENGVYDAEDYDVNGFDSVEVNVPDNGNYFYFEAISTGVTVELRRNNNAPEVSLEYSFDKSLWSAYTYTTVIEVENGSKVYFKGNNPNGFYQNNSENRFVCTGQVNIGGDIRSLVDKAMTITGIPADNCFRKLFYENQSIISVDRDLLRGFMYLKSGCYANMFQSCTSLTTAPELPATGVSGSSAYSAYGYMFAQCSSLVNAPSVLPSFNIWNAPYLYSNMFRNCTSLQKAPIILKPNSRTNTGCYNQMFSGCTSLNYIKCSTHPLLWGSRFYENWAAGVPSGGTFVKDYDNSNWEIGVNGIPEGWNILNDDTPITGTTINSNGVFLASGTTWDSVTVNVPTGITPSGTIEITENGTYDVTEKANANVQIDTQAYYNSGYTDGYQSGTTDGFQSGYTSGYTAGVESVPLVSTGFTSNGTFSAATGGFNIVTVNVPTGITPSGTIQITGNSNYDVSQYQYANVNVPTGITPTGQITISGNGTYDVTQYASANVNIPLNSTGFTSNGTYTKQNGGWNEVTVNVPLSTTGITSNGTYTKESGGWNVVTVNVPSVTTQTMTQAQYDALTIKDPMVIYLING